MIVLNDINLYPERVPLEEEFSRIELMDIWIVNIILNYIYTHVEESCQVLNRKTKYMTRYGLRHGEFKEWFLVDPTTEKNIEHQLNRIAYYKNNILYGKQTVWNLDGSLDYEIFYNDRGHVQYSRIWYRYCTMIEKEKIMLSEDKSEQREYYENGALRVRYLTKKCDKHGEYSSYFPSGKLYIRTTYKNDRPYGLYQRFYENGELDVQVYYDKDVRNDHTDSDNDSEDSNDKPIINETCQPF